MIAQKIKLRPEQVELRPCGPDQLARILEMQEEAFAAIEDPAILRRNPPEALAACLLPPHYTLGAFLDGRLIAFVILFDGEHTEENMAYSMGMDSDADCVMNMKLVIVSPAYWGNGLQLRLMLAVEDEARARGKRVLAGTAAPENLPSCKNFLRAGYILHSTLKKYGGLTRNLYYKKL